MTDPGSDEYATQFCSHTWIDPLDLPAERLAYVGIIGRRRYEMKYGRFYRCRLCGSTLTTPPAPEQPAA